MLLLTVALVLIAGACARQDARYTINNYGQRVEVKEYDQNSPPGLWQLHDPSLMVSSPEGVEAILLGMTNAEVADNLYFDSSPCEVWEGGWGCVRTYTMFGQPTEAVAIDHRDIVKSLYLYRCDDIANIDTCRVVAVRALIFYDHYYRITSTASELFGNPLFVRERELFDSESGRMVEMKEAFWQDENSFILTETFVGQGEIATFTFGLNSEITPDMKRQLEEGGLEVKL